MLLKNVMLFVKWWRIKQRNWFISEKPLVSFLHTWIYFSWILHIWNNIEQFFKTSVWSLMTWCLPFNELLNFSFHKIISSVVLHFKATGCCEDTNLTKADERRHFLLVPQNHFSLDAVAESKTTKKKEKKATNDTWRFHLQGQRTMSSYCDYPVLL